MSALAQPIPAESSVAIGHCSNCGEKVCFGKQFWQCDECGQVRVWGWASAERRSLKPLLNCEGCGEPTRHGYMGLAGIAR